MKIKILNVNDVRFQVVYNVRILPIQYNIAINVILVLNI